MIFPFKVAGLIGYVFLNSPAAAYRSFFQGGVPYFKILFLDFKIGGGGFFDDKYNDSTTPSDFVRTPLLKKRRGNLEPINPALKGIGGCKYASILLIALFAYQPKEQTQKENLPYYNTADFTPNWYTKKQVDTLKLHKIADFSFIDQDGKKISNENVKGKIYVANFFFTICPSICPTMTQNLLAVHDTFKNDADVMMLSHSVMPATDTVAQLKKYANRWKIDTQRWHLLTGEKDKIYALARQSYFAEKEIGLQKDKNEFLHTENAFLIDKNGYIRGVYNATLPLDVENLVKDIQVLKAE